MPLDESAKQRPTLEPDYERLHAKNAFIGVLEERVTRDGELLTLPSDFTDASLEEWVGYWHLDAPCVREWLREQAELRRHGLVGLSSNRGLPAEALDLVAGVPDLRPHLLVQARDAFIKSAGAQWDAFHERVNIRIQKKRHQVGDHAEWTLRFQLGESAEVLARATDRSRKTVADAVKAFALRIDLKMRHASRGGRPKTRRI